MPLRAILLFLWFIPSLPLCFISPFYGVIMWTIVSFLNPQEYTWGAYLFPWAMAVAIPTIAGFAVSSRSWGRILSRETVIMLIMWVWFGISTIISINTPLFAHHADATVDKWVFVTKVFLMTVVSIGIVDSFARLRTFVMVISGCFGFYVLKSLPFLILSGGSDRIYGPPKSMIADNNDFGLALNMTLPMFFFLAQSETRPWLKRLYWGLFIVTIPAILFTYSRGALLGLLAIGGLMMLRLKRQAFLLIPVIIFGAIIALLFAPEAWRDRMDPTRKGALDLSAQSRLNSWTYSWNLATDYPIAGGGFDTFTRELFVRYAPNPADVHGPHSIYFGILAEHGFIGLFLYLLLIFSCFSSTWRITRWARLYGDQVIINYANMFQLSIVGFLASGAFLGRQYFDYYYTIIACIAILKRVAFTAWESADDPGYESQEAAA